MKYLLILLPLWVQAQHIELEAWQSKQGIQFNSGGILVGMTKSSYCDYAVYLAPGQYDLYLRYATTQNNVKVALSYGVYTDTISLTNTGSWSLYNTFSKRYVLPFDAWNPATATMRFTQISQEAANYDWLELRIDALDMPPRSDTTQCIKYEYDSLGWMRTRQAKYFVVKKDKPINYFIDDKGRQVDILQYRTDYGWILVTSQQ